MPFYAIIAHPVEHSLSPAIHTAAFTALGLTDHRYQAFDTPPAMLRQRIDEMREFGHKGYSISIPHKVEGVQYLDVVRPKAKAIGAVNTIINHNGQLIGDNTDYGGFMVVMSEAGFITGQNKKAVVLGAGGAALAIVSVLLDLKFNVLVVARDPLKARTSLRHLLADSSGTIAFLSFEAFTPEVTFDVLINTTPVGMSPQTEESPLPSTEYFREGRTVIDIIYNPLETKLLRSAREKGCRTISGDRMFLWQAVGQTELWTGQKAPIKAMEDELKRQLEGMK